VSETNCPDCAVTPGQPHEDGCDVARCLVDGGQRLQCGRAAAHNCGQDVWTGEWPGDAECREFGWWVQDRCSEGLGWVPCAPNAPGATEDLNRLHRDARWSPERARWVLR
jgi:hypothetical protein